MKKSILTYILLCLSILNLNARGRQPQKKLAVTTSVGCPIPTAQSDLNVNNVRARILNAGDLWSDPVAQNPHYEIPIGSGKHSIWCGGFWLGGYDGSGALKMAAQTYRQQGANDFWAGPIAKDVVTDSLSITTAQCSQYDRI